jgi:hypothetical protein
MSRNLRTLENVHMPFHEVKEREAFLLGNGSLSPVTENW